jgi:lysophospholipase L1-like esterase
MLPDEGAILLHRKTGSWPYGDLVEAIAATGMKVLDVGEVFERHLGPRDPGDLFEATLHYNDEGYRAMAAAIEPALLEMAGGSIAAAGR